MTLELSGIGIATTFAAGAVSFLSPCVLPLVPGYIAYVTGHAIAPSSTSEESTDVWARLRVLSLSTSFVLGFTTVFVALGAGANAISSVLSVHRYEINVLSGALVILFGVFTTGLWRPGWLERDTRLQLKLVGGGPVSAYLLGFAFAFAWTPCIGPVLGAVLAVAASSSQGSGGVALLAIYSLGLGLPFVLSALFFSQFVKQIAKFRRAGHLLQILAGIVMIAMGLAMITGYLTILAFWFLETFPTLSRIG